jgi:type II secretory pathway component GspD/PulD (secretin)
MNAKCLKQKRWLTVAIGLCLCAIASVQAQQQAARPGGTSGGFGGFGGGGTANRGGSISGTGSYNANGTVGNATISYDPDTHNITILADKDTTEEITNVIASLDRPQPQVLIKVVFLQVTHSDATDIGVEGGWMNGIGGGRTGQVANSFGLSSLASGTGSNAPVLNAFGLPVSSFSQIAPFAAGPGAGMYQILGSDFQATLRAIAAMGKAEVLSRPSILARNDQPASVIVGQEVPLITSVSYNTISGAPINSVTYTSVGIILTVTPYITSDGMVQMIIAPQDSSIDPTLTVPIAQGVNAPVIDTVSANTVAITPNGQTVVIGGLMQRDKTSAEQKIPILGDIPFLGNVFKRRTASNAREELMIFLTPYVVQAPTQLAALANTEKARTLIPKSYSEQELDRFLDKVPAKQLKGGKSGSSATVQ